MLIFTNKGITNFVYPWITSLYSDVKSFSIGYRGSTWPVTYLAMMVLQLYSDLLEDCYVVLQFITNQMAG